MLRRPAILVLLLFLLSLGVVAFFTHELRKPPRPTMSELDAFVTQTPWPGGWRISGLSAGGGGSRSPGSGWMKWFNRETSQQTLSYGFQNSRTSHGAAIHVTWTDGNITKVAIDPPVNDLKDHLYGKFPALRPYDAPP